MTASKIVAAAASGTASEGLDIQDVFQPFLYEGNGGSQSIQNGLDLSTDGGLVWIKQRSGTEIHWLVDSERALNQGLSSSSASVYTGYNGRVSSFNNDGFTVGATSDVNSNGQDYASWTFKKTPKFFDIVTWTGNGAGDRVLTHNLGHTIGMAFVKELVSSGASYSGNWSVYHRNMGAASSTDGTNQSDFMNLNDTAGRGDGTGVGPIRSPSSTQFTIRGGGSGEYNRSGVEYIAYLFAHHNNDGEFGPNQDQDIIKCGTYQGNGNYSTGKTVNVGFEPDWLIMKRISGGTGGWKMLETQRGWETVQGNQPVMQANNNSAETLSGSGLMLDPQNNGFTIYDSDASINGNGNHYLYMAIRKGTLFTAGDKEPATKFFNVANTSGTSGNKVNVGFIPDMHLTYLNNNSKNLLSRHRKFKYLQTSSTSTQTNQNNAQWWLSATNTIDTATNWYSSSSNVRQYSWRRAPGYFDQTMYYGNGSSSHAINHSLGAVPEMIWIKNTQLGENWAVYHKDHGAAKHLRLNSNDMTSSSSTRFAAVNPTSTQFTVGSDNEVNRSNDQFVAYLFATVAGVSKVGNYTGNGGSTANVIDCGFSNGARFVLIKRADTSGNWVFYDTARGINSGHDVEGTLNNTNGDTTGVDMIDPHASGFSLPSNRADNNASGGVYFFYAIA